MSVAESPSISINNNVLLPQISLGSSTNNQPLIGQLVPVVQSVLSSHQNSLHTIHVGRVLYCQLCHQKKKGHRCPRVPCQSHEHCGVGYLHNSKSRKRQRILDARSSSVKGDADKSSSKDTSPQSEPAS